MMSLVSYVGDTHCWENICLLIETKHYQNASRTNEKLFLPCVCVCDSQDGPLACCGLGDVTLQSPPGVVAVGTEFSSPSQRGHSTEHPEVFPHHRYLHLPHRHTQSHQTHQHHPHHCLNNHQIPPNYRQHHYKNIITSNNLAIEGSRATKTSQGKHTSSLIC